MDKIKAFLAFQEATEAKLHRVAHANLDQCYSYFSMEDLLLILKEKQELAQNAGILSTHFYDGICNVQVAYERFQRLTKGVKNIRSERSMLTEFEHKRYYAKVEGIHLVAIRIIKKKMQAQ